MCLSSVPTRRVTISCICLIFCFIFNFYLFTADLEQQLVERRPKISTYRIAKQKSGRLRRLRYDARHVADIFPLQKHVHFAERRTKVGVRLPALDHQVVELARTAGRPGRTTDRRQTAAAGVEVGEHGLVTARKDVVEGPSMSSQSQDLPQRHTERPHIRLRRHLTLLIRIQP